MLHGYEPEYAGQGRGYSALTHALQEFENLTSLGLSNIQKAINQASFVMAIENEQQDASQPLAGGVAGPIVQYGANPIPPADAQNVTEGSTDPIPNFSAMPEATMTQPGSGVFGNFKKGDKVKFLQDTSSAVQFNVFVETFFSVISASTGYSIETVLKKFNANYSASRATLILCWRVANIQRLDQNSDFDNPVFESWLSEEIAAGRIQAPGWEDVLLRSAWLNCEWAGAPMPNIDPLKTAEADRAYVEMGAQTLDDVARNFNGSSGKANRIKNERQYQELPEPPWKAVPPAPVDENNNDEGDNNNG